MKQNTIVKTFISRFLILILNFGLVVYTTNMWGSEGKGVVSIVIADLTIYEGQEATVHTRLLQSTDLS